jgi:hypothetical protein
MRAIHGAIFLKYVMWYFYNVSAKTIIESVYGHTSEESEYTDYLKSKINLITKNPLGWYSDLDEDHRIEFCQLVLEKYNTKGEFNV